MMETRKEIAAEKKRCGSHNCTQAVVCTYYDYTGMDEETLSNVGNAFAAGMGNMEGTCGALVGAGVVLGLATKDKAKSVKAMRQIMTQFQQRNGATQCKLLKGVGTGKVLRECPLCVADAAELLEEQLDKLTEPTLKSKACLKCLYFTIIIFDLCRYLEYFSYLYTINQTE